MLRAIVIGLGLAGLAMWAGRRAGAGVKEGVADLVGGGGTARGLDGSDATAEWRAGIADENVVPGAAH
jgi:hypothetical protein